jgi:hypothetical protein
VLLLLLLLSLLLLGAPGNDRPGVPSSCCRSAAAVRRTCKEKKIHIT